MKKKQLPNPHPEDILIGSKIRLQRQAAGLSQDKLGKAIGVTFQQVQKYENAQNRVCARYLKDIANHLKIDITYFFEGIKNTDDKDTLIEPEVTGEELRLIRNLRKIPNAKASIKAIVQTLSEK